MRNNQLIGKMLNALVTGKNFDNKDLNNYIYASLSQPPIKIIDKNDSDDECDYTVECPNCGCYVNYGTQIFMRSGHIYCNNKGCLEKLENKTYQKKAIINKEVAHQGIGGKEIILEKELIVKDFLDTNFNEMSIAIFNFINRRLDFINEENENKKVYYGHVGNLGYFVAEDEIERFEDENYIYTLRT